MTTDDSATGSPHAFLAGGGKVAEIISVFDWSKTPLGPLQGWPTSIKTTVALMQRSPVPIVALFGEQGTMIYNDAYSVFAGGRHPRLLGSAVREGWPEVADFNDNVMKVGLAGGTLSYRERELVLFRSGQPERVSLNLDYSPVIGESGEPIGVIAIVVEITEAVIASRRLRENEKRLQFLDALGKETAKSTDADTILAVTTRMVGEHLGVSSCAYADMDADQDGFTIRGDWAAPGAQHIVGHYRLADFGKLAVANLGIGKPLVVNDNLKELEPEEAAAFQNIGIGATICMPLVKEGRLTALMAIHHQGPHQWTDNELALITEVTERSWAHIERVRSEAEVHEGERRFREELEAQVAERTAAVQQSEKTIRTIFETSYMNQGLLTTDGKIVYVNATSLASINSRFEDVVGKDFWETPWFTGTPGMPEQVKAGIERVAAGESVQIAMPLNMPTGHRIYEFSMRPAMDETGKVVALVPEAVEITARVRAEQALQQAMKVEAIGNLTGGIAHDFNNLLMAILGSLELLRKRLPENESLVRLLDNAMEGARRGKSLTTRMLAFARKQDLKPERTDLGRLARGMAELMQRSLGPLITIDIRIDPHLPEVEIDPNQLETALLNLAVNARDAMHGEGLMVIAAQDANVGDEQSGLKCGKYVRLSVADTGEGMDAETLARATEPFFTTKGIGKGTGLGLSMVHGLAEQSGGKLILTSAPGAGTTAEIWLPAVGTVTEPQPDELAADPQIAAISRRLTILAVDDDPLILINVVDMLEDLGHVVVPAGSGKEALQRLGERKFNLLVTDHAMPQMTGAQLVAQARARYPELAVILATGYAELAPGAQIDVPRLSKPFSQADLAAALADAMRASAAPARG
jgi:signal transduction histidine kinase/ActR/RegA family two-component response regulator